MSLESSFNRFGPEFSKAIMLFDQHNSTDPNQDFEKGELQPRELIYARRLTSWIFKLDPHPPESVLLASRCQHIGRWAVPRTSYPMTRPGYLAWRSGLKKYHADLAAKLLGTAGYKDSMIEKVRNLVLKTNLRNDPEMQLIEDALCLVFLEFQFAELASRTEEAKMLNALQKSWSKMSSKAREHALLLPFSPFELDLVKKALSLPRSSESPRTESPGEI